MLSLLVHMGGPVEGLLKPPFGGGLENVSRWASGLGVGRWLDFSPHLTVHKLQPFTVASSDVFLCFSKNKTEYARSLLFYNKSRVVRVQFQTTLRSGIVIKRVGGFLLLESLAFHV